MADTQQPLDLSPRVHVLEERKPEHQHYFDKMHQWQMNHYSRFLNTLSGPERRMLDYDRPLKITYLNEHLRKKLDLPPWAGAQKRMVDDSVKTMNGLIDRSPPIKNDMIVYRGVGGFKPGDAPEPGSTLYDPGFQSTSLNANLSGHTFSKHQTVFKIHVPSGTRMGPVTAHQVGKFGIYPNTERFRDMDQELVLGTGHSLRVLRPLYQDKNTKLHTLDVALLPQGPPPKTPTTPQHTWVKENPARLNYEKIVRRVFYANTARQSQEPLDLTPHDFILPGSNVAIGGPYYHKMHEFQMNQYGDFVKTLSPTEQKSLESNKPEPLKISRMNSYLTGHTEVPYFSGQPGVSPELVPHIKKGIETMDGIISRAPPLPHDLIVYRGMGSIAPKDAPKKGSILYSPGFQSTSLNAFVSKGAFSNHRAVARIHIPAGTRLAPLTAHQISHNNIGPDERMFRMMEQELLLGRNHHMLVTHPINYNPKTSTYHLNMRLLPQGPAPVSEPGSPVLRQAHWIVKQHT